MESFPAFVTTVEDFLIMLKIAKPNCSSASATRAFRTQLDASRGLREIACQNNKDGKSDILSSLLSS
jgi:hypothetical protein